MIDTCRIDQTHTVRKSHAIARRWYALTVGAGLCTLSITAFLACILALASAAVVFTVAVMLSTKSSADDGDVAVPSCAVTRDEEEDAGAALDVAGPLACPFAERFDLLGRGRSTRPLSPVLLMVVDVGGVSRASVE